MKKKNRKLSNNTTRVPVLEDPVASSKEIDKIRELMVKQKHKNEIDNTSWGRGVAEGLSLALKVLGAEKYKGGYSYE